MGQRGKGGFQQDALLPPLPPAVHGCFLFFNRIMSLSLRGGCSNMSCFTVPDDNSRRAVSGQGRLPPRESRACFGLEPCLEIPTQRSFRSAKLGFCSGCKNDIFALKSLPCVRWGRICWKEKRLVFPAGGSDKAAWLKRASCGPAACPSAGLLAKTCPEATQTSCWREQVATEDKLHMVLVEQPGGGQPGSVHPAEAPLDHLHFKSPSGSLVA